jgi:hypothetical protein
VSPVFFFLSLSSSSFFHHIFDTLCGGPRCSEKELKAIPVSADDVKVLVEEFDMERVAAEASLRTHGGLAPAIRALATGEVPAGAADKEQ